MTQGSTSLARDLGLTNTPPETLRIAFAPVTDDAAGIAQAEAYTRQLTNSHYENFSVVSRLLPAELRQDFCNVYAFCRVADDLGDEAGDRNRALELLGGFKRQTRDMFGLEAAPGAPAAVRTAVFVALRQTVLRHQIPAQPFLDLIDAFEQDQRVTRYETFEQVVDYCRRSADPVGRLVLYMCGYRDPERQGLSDRTCTALQLTNFWQDVRRDILERDRIYLPRDSMARFGVTEEQLRQGRCDENFRRLLEFEVARTEKLFAQGAALLPLVDRRYRGQIALFGRGGRAILQAIRAQGYDTLTRRPKLGRWQKLRLVLVVLAGRIWSGPRRAAASAGSVGN
jgi:squalene synthase HpnC